MRLPRRKVAIASTDEVSRDEALWDHADDRGDGGEDRVVERASVHEELRRNSPSPSGTRTTVPRRMIALRVVWISERTALTYLASALMRAA